jgi:hypothetical protein
VLIAQPLLQRSGGHQQGSGGHHRQLKAHIPQPLGSDHQHAGANKQQQSQGASLAPQLQQHQGRRRHQCRPHHGGLGASQQYKQADHAPTQAQAQRREQLGGERQQHAEQHAQLEPRSGQRMGEASGAEGTAHLHRKGGGRTAHHQGRQQIAPFSAGLLLQCPGQTPPHGGNRSRLPLQHLPLFHL